MGIRSGIACPVVLLSAAAGLAAEDGVAPVTTVFGGDYRVARLDLPASIDGRPGSLFLSLRDGQLAALWFVTPMAGDRRIHVAASEVRLEGGTLAGRATLRTAENRGRPMIEGALALDLAVTGESLSGRYEIAIRHAAYQPAQGAATGRLVAKAPPGDALAANASWTCFWGSRGDMSAEPGQPLLIDDLARARPVWRSEAPVPVAYGNAPDSRYFTRAVIAGNGGGGGSPVVAGGTVYVSFYVPSKDSPSNKDDVFWRKAYPAAEDFVADMARLNASPAEQGWVLNHFRLIADDHVVALDAATGATRWRTVLPNRSINVQTHKWRATSPVPLAAGGTLYVPNLNARLYALDAATGALRWEFPECKAPQQPLAGFKGGPANPSPFLAGGHVIWVRDRQIHALDPATGALRWRQPGGYLLPFSAGGRAALVTFRDGKMTAYDATDGATLWSVPCDAAPEAPLSAVMAGDVLIAAPALDKTSGTCAYRGWRLAERGATEVWKDEPIRPDENLPVTVANGRAYFLGRDYIRVLDASTGRKVGERAFGEKENGPRSNAWLGFLGDRLLFSPEGQHGGTLLGLLAPDLGTVGSWWRPPHTETSAYNSQPVVYPLVDGRLFVRGGDGIYCYDLRRP
jgi:outer membrane protein assembly factor BamB